MNEKGDGRLLGIAALGLVLAVGGCSKKMETAGKGDSPAGFWSATPIGGGEIVHEKVVVDGQMVEVRHSKLDSGRLEEMFDNDLKNLARTEKANPAVISLDFPNPRAMKGISVTTASMDIGLMARVTTAGSADPKVYSKEFRSLPPEPTVTLDFDPGADPVQKLHIEVTKLGGSDGHIHIREIHFN